MTSTRVIESVTQPQVRNVKAAPLNSYGAHINRWAIIVGVSQYKHQRLNLKYADRDAQELYKLLQTPSGGGFEAERITKLINEEATTANIQHPLIGPNLFDRNLPIAITGSINAQEHYQLGCRLCDMGWLLDDNKRFQAAAEQFNEAISLSHMAMTPFPGAELGLGQALVALGKHKGAIHILSGLIERNSDETQAQALFLLGIAQAKILDYPSAVLTFENFLAQYPDDDNSMWVREYIGWLKSKTSNRKYGLLIGINQYVSPNIPRLTGCLNDAHMMEKVLLQRYGFEESNMILLLDNNATRQGILNAFESLSQKATLADTVLVYYSGHSIPQSHRDAFKAKPEIDLYLVVHDTINESGSMSNGISPTELHQMMNAITSMNKTLILDTHPNTQFNEFVEKEGNYTLLLATDSAEIAYESQFEIEGKIVPAGLFTSVLFRQLEESKSNSITYGQLLDRSIVNIKTLGFNQTPLLIGDREQLIFEREEIYMTLFEFSRRRNYNSLTIESLEKNYSLYRKKVAAVYAGFHYSFGRAFLEKDKPVEAMNALQTALQQRNGHYPEALFALGRAQAGAGHFAEALESFKKYAQVVPEETIAVAQELIGKTERLIHSKKHALLVGIDEYISMDILHVRGARNDVQAFKEVLMTKSGFQEEDIKVLLNQDATRTAILDNFRQLVEKAREEPAMFYFAGNGSITNDDGPTIVSTDGRQGVVSDIALEELAEIAGAIDPSNLVTIMDAGWTLPYKDFDGSRTIPRDSREGNSTRDIGYIGRARELEKYKINIGFLSIYANSIKSSFSSQTYKSETKFGGTRSGSKGKYHGILTHALIQDFNKNKAGNITYSEWFTSVSDVSESFVPVVIGDHQEQQKDFFPEGKLNLGIAYAAIGEYKKSILALEKAIELYSDTTIMAYENEKDHYAREHYHDANYQLGRILFESGGDFNRAISALNEATNLDPENTRAYYYLGQAIRAMVDRETLVKAEEALKTYLARGSPMGHEDKVREFLGSRMAKDTMKKGIIQDSRI